MQEGQRDSGKGKSVVADSDLERLMDKMCHKLVCWNNPSQLHVQRDSRSH